MLGSVAGLGIEMIRGRSISGSFVHNDCHQKIAAKPRIFGQ